MRPAPDLFLLERYDVAHVLKWSRFKHVRMEFARAYELLASSGAGNATSSLLETVCDQVKRQNYIREKCCRGRLTEMIHAA